MIRRFPICTEPRMAAAKSSSFSFTTFSAAALLLLGSLVGCQAPKQRMVVDTLPPQNFNGPSLATKSPAPAPAPPAPAPQQPKLTIPPPVARGPGMLAPKEWEPRAAARPWKWIVIHHSATPTGGAVAFDR